MRTPLAALLLAAVAFSAPVALADDKDDLDKLQGHWKAVIGPAKDIPIFLEIKGDKSTLKATAADGQEVVVTGELKIDPKAHTLDALKRTLSDGRAMPDNLTLYQLDGDTLKICSNGPGKPRPEKFEEGKDGPPLITVFTRVKDDKK
jgi:uncharacterized protein (TIGR03067 family)